MQKQNCDSQSVFAKGYEENVHFLSSHLHRWKSIRIVCESIRKLWGMWVGAGTRKQGVDEEDGGEPSPSGQPYVWATETTPKLRNTGDVCQGQCSLSFRDRSLCSCLHTGVLPAKWWHTISSTEAGQWTRPQYQEPSTPQVCFKILFQSSVAREHDFGNLALVRILQILLTKGAEPSDLPLPFCTWEGVGDVHLQKISKRQSYCHCIDTLGAATWGGLREETRGNQESNDLARGILPVPERV